MALLTSMRVKGYRLFESLAVEGLTRVNVFVGRNNSGKTALLEAASIAVAADFPLALYRSSLERNEDIRDREPNKRLFDPRNWFFGWRMEDARFRIEGERAGTLFVELVAKQKLATGSEGDLSGFAAPAPDGTIVSFKTVLFASTDRMPASIALPLTPNGLLGAGDPALTMTNALKLPEPVMLMTTRLRTPWELASAWDRIQLTPGEENVVAALRYLEPKATRVGFLAERFAEASRVRVLLEGGTTPVPLGSLGEGASRLFSLALFLSVCKGGTLLIDEIDTGLHYSVMAKMWQMVIETARRLDVQVFATTHSQDCVHALGWVYERFPDLAGDVSLHRLERGREETTRLGADEIAAAAKHQIEVR